MHTSIAETFSHHSTKHLDKQAFECQEPSFIDTINTKEPDNLPQPITSLPFSPCLAISEEYKDLIRTVETYKQETNNLRTEFNKKIEHLRNEKNTEISNLRAETEMELNNMRQSLKNTTKGFVHKSEIQDIKGLSKTWFWFDKPCDLTLKVTSAIYYNKYRTNLKPFSLWPSYEHTNDIIVGLSGGLLPEYVCYGIRKTIIEPTFSLIESSVNLATSLLTHALHTTLVGESTLNEGSNT